MATKPEPTPKERPARPQRATPIPLADRRRMLRKVAEKDTGKTLFTDWASI